MKDTLGVLLAGGAGERLYPLTRDRAKPAVTFGGNYRIIDITLSNCINSDLRRIYILTQYKALSLNRHIREGWGTVIARELGEFIEIMPPMKRVSDNWYLGTADAVYQNIYSIGSEQPKYVLILSGDHIYKMNYQLMLDQHCAAGADVTLATILIDPSESFRFGVMEIGADGHITGFEEKPRVTKLRSPYNPEMVSGSMGVYLFNTDVTSCLRSWTTTKSIRSTSLMKTRKRPFTGATLARLRLITKRTWIWWQFLQSSTSTTINGQSAPTSASILQRNSSLASQDARARQLIRLCHPAAFSPAAPCAIACFPRM